MDWKVGVFLILLAVVLVGFIVLGVLYSREKAKRRRAEAVKNQREGEVRRLVTERKIEKLNDEEAVNELTCMLDRWSPTSPGSGIGGGTGLDDGI